MKRTLVSWFPFAVALTAVALMVYAAVQQVYRSSANDPQIQMAEDAAARLAAGAPPETVVAGEPVDMARSLAPFMIVFSDSGAPVAASVRIEGRVPALPAGVLTAARSVPEQRLTWQPRPGVRSAIVIRHYGGASPGFVLAGRSLREVEQRVARLVSIVATIWIASTGLLLVYFAFAAKTP